MRRGYGIAAAAGAALALGSPAHARDMTWIEIQAGTLKAGLRALGAQTRSSIALADPSMADLKIGKIRGRMTADQALRRMVRGLEVDVVVLDSSSFRLVPAPRRRPRRSANLTALPAPKIQKMQPRAEIIVTASKRQTSRSQYQGIVQTIEADDLAQAEFRGTEAIERAGTSLSSTHLGPGRDKLFLRGVGDSSFSGHTQAIVGQYLGEARLNYSGPDPDLRLYDIARTEILLGPQGTLYGAGSLGGIMRIEPNQPDPDHTQLYAILSTSAIKGGALGAEAAAMVNLPLGWSEGAVRLVGYRVREGGYIDDVARGVINSNRLDISGGRAALAVAPDGAWRAEMLSVWQDIEGRDAGYVDRRVGPLARAAAIAQPYSNRFRLVSTTLRGEQEGVDIAANLSHSHARLRDIFDASEPLPNTLALARREMSDVSSAEIRVSRSGSAGNGWLVGGSMVDSRTRFSSSLLYRSEAPFETNTAASIREYILFGEASEAIGPLALSIGARAARWRGRGLHMSGANSPEAPFDWSDAGWKILPGASALLTLPSDIQLLVRYAESYRPPTAAASSAGFIALSGDHYSAWEAAVRRPDGEGRTLTGALSLSAGRWRNVQADIIDHAGYLTAANIGDARTLTIETNAQLRLSECLTLNGAVTMNRAIVNAAEPSHIIVAEGRLPNIPDMNARLAVQYDSPSSAKNPYRLSATLRHTGRSRLGIGPELGREQGGFSDVDLDASLKLGSAKLHLGVSNLFDAAGNRFALGSLAQPAESDLFVPQTPRRVSLGIRIGGR
ncbi:hypothetical protein SKP52_08075 [Sphingopyxis fribergensis]|uniref:Uncharacterized protein n=1 Tax=Sphingopyxis fribergensis TaxID=1515612 RepID=A0A0A7PEY0_9SPHN|nr:TonB-dependent receptor [Sphingopyxis fribergensis]AJA08534.1 hypothetical protein SKP52_08075 [Sphingopyxis fribergensis]